MTKDETVDAILANGTYGPTSVLMRRLKATMMLKFTVAEVENPDGAEWYGGTVRFKLDYPLSVLSRFHQYRFLGKMRRRPDILVSPSYVDK